MFDLDAYLAARRDAVDAALDAAMPPADAPPAALHDAMRYSVFSGGKRLRPILCLAAAEAVRPAGEPGGADAAAAAAMPAAIAVEAFHTYTLVHDDLPSMDDDDLRRGRPTVHVRYGEAAAILAGDALQALAFEWLARARPPAPYAAADLVLELAEAGGSRGVVGGQAADIAAVGTAPAEATVDYVHRHKTAVLFRAAVRMGAMCGGAGERALAAAERYALNLGIAFQIADDLLDADPHGAAGGELSCLAVWTPDEARQRAGALVNDGIAALRALGGTTDPLAALARFAVARTH